MQRLTAFCSVVAIGGFGASATGQSTPIDEIVLYGIDDNTHELLRYEFGDDSYRSLGQVKTADGIVLAELESLAFIGGRHYLYGCWNTGSGSASTLMKIDLFTAEAWPVGSGIGFGNVEGLTHVEDLNEGPGPDALTSVILTDANGVDAFEVSFVEVTWNNDGTSSWTYHVRELDSGKDLSHWNLGLSESHEVMPGTTPGYVVGIDGSTGFYGIKWDVGDGFSEGDFTIVLDKHYRGTEGGNGIGVLAKGGKSPDTGEIFGPTDQLPQGHKFYAVHSDNLGNMALISIDPNTGAGEHVMDLSRQYEGLAVSHDGTLLAVSNNTLYRIDPFADTETAIGAQLFSEIEALEFAFGADDPAIDIPGVSSEWTAGGALFGYSDHQNTLLVINPVTGQSLSYYWSMPTSDIEGIVSVNCDRDVMETVLACTYD